MSWLFSRALVAEYLQDTCLDGAPSAPSSVTHTPQAYLPPDKMTDFCRPSQYGMTFAPLTADLGEVVLTLFLEDFHAKTSASPDAAQGSTASDQDCGDIWPGSLARFDPATSTWKTAQHSLFADLIECSVTLPRSGMTAGGQCWELPMSARPTNVTDFGFWPTPTVCGNYNRKGASAKSGDGLATAVRRMWRTPSSAVIDPKSTVVKLAGRKPSDPQVGLVDQVGGKLNPTWVEWLMGWPLGWTELKPLAMGKSPSAPPWPGDN